MGSCFDEGKDDAYKNEFEERIQFCKFLPNSYEVLEDKMK